MIQQNKMHIVAVNATAESAFKGYNSKQIIQEITNDKQTPGLHRRIGRDAIDLLPLIIHFT
jgi:hypothetical protein